MRRRSLVLIMLIACSLSMLLSPVFGGAFGEVLLVDDVTDQGDGSSNGYYGLEKLSHSPLVFGLRASPGNSFDINTYQDTILIESSLSSGDAVNFVVLDGDSWSSPPNLEAEIPSDNGDYIIEMENEIDEHPVGTSWVGHIDRPEGLVLNIGSPGFLDDEGIYGPSVVFAQGEYHMWYTMFDGSFERIGYANSKDGIEWDKRPQSVLHPEDTWEQFGVSHPSVLFNDNTYHMWYTGENENIKAIGYATSTDGIEWEKYDFNPVFEKGFGSWDGSGVSQPSVLYDDPYFHMWYAGYDGEDYSIGYAWSFDGMHWSKDGNPVLNPTVYSFFDDSWDRINTFAPSVIYDGSTFHMWYAGDEGKNTRIGYAISDDGRTWTKYETNPVLDIGPSGSWDDIHLTDPTVIQEGTTYRMWYTGNNGNIKRIGYASSENLNPWNKIQSYPEVLDTHVVTGIVEDLTYTIELDVPLKVDLDMFIFSGSGGRDDALVSSIRPGAGTDESITFTAPFSGDYILVITNEDGATGLYTVITNNPPLPNIMGDLVTDENGIISLETEARYPVVTDDYNIYPGVRVAVSPDGSYLAVGWGKCISLFSTKSSLPLWTLDINEPAIDFKFTDNGENLAVLGNKTLYFFNTRSCIPLWSYEDTGYHPFSLTGNRMDMSRDGRFIAINAWGNRVLVFDTTSATPTIPYWEYDFGDEVITVKISGDGKYLAMGGKHGHEFRLGWIPGKSIEWTYSSGDTFLSGSISNDGSTISFGQGVQHNVGLFNSASSNPEWTFELEGTQIKQAMSDDGSYFVSSNTWDNTPNSWSGFALWDTNSSIPVWEYHVSDDVGSGVNTVDMDRQANYVVGGSLDYNVYLFSQLGDGESGWSNADGKPVYEYATGGDVWCNAVSISADGTYFAAGSFDGNVYLFTTEGEQPHLLWKWNPTLSLPATGNYSWDFDALVDEDDDGDKTNDGDFYGPNSTYTYKRNGNYTVTLTLTTDEGTVHTYTMFVTVDVFEEEESIWDPVMKPGLPLAGIALMVGLILSLFFGKTEVGNYRLIPVIFPLYSRLRKNELLDQDTRSLIFRYIQEHPGDNYSSIRENLGLNNGTLVYHLKTLERENYIKSMRDGRYKRFYPVDAKVQRVNGFGTGSVQGRILVCLTGRPGLTQREIAGELSLSQQVVSYHLKLMQETEHVRVRREGKKNHYYVNESLPWSNM